MTKKIHNEIEDIEKASKKVHKNDDIKYGKIDGSIKELTKEIEQKNKELLKKRQGRGVKK